MATGRKPSRVAISTASQLRVGLRRQQALFGQAAVIDTISAFGAAEFALATYSRTSAWPGLRRQLRLHGLGGGRGLRRCPGDGTTQKYCAYHAATATWSVPREPAAPTAPIRRTPTTWCSTGALSTVSTPSAASPRAASAGRSSSGSPDGTSNLVDIYHWIDGKEDLPPFRPARTARFARSP
jgi:hypothetical protein